MEIMELEVVQLELKYCETCGGLWLRPKGSKRVECASCAARSERWFHRLGKGPRLPRIRSVELERARSDMPEWLPAPADWGSA